jgi:hypothetical protein
VRPDSLAGELRSDVGDGRATIVELQNVGNRRRMMAAIGAGGVAYQFLRSH